MMANPYDKPKIFSDQEKPEDDLPHEIRTKLQRAEELEKQVAELTHRNKALTDRIEVIGAQPPAPDAERTADGRYRLRIDLPSSGGLCLVRNGVEYFHGQEYEVPWDQLVDMREQMHRAWKHEETIRGSNENAYRRPSNNRLSMAGR